MKEKFKLIFFIKISTFILLTWGYHLKNEVGKYNIYLDEKCDVDGKLGPTTYRLLAKYKKENCSSTVRINEVIPNNGTYEKKDTYYNEKIVKGKNIRTNKYSLNNGGDYKVPRRSKSSTCIGRNSYSGKRTFDKIYYKNIVRNATIADFNSLKKGIKKKQFWIFTLSIFYVVNGILLYFLNKIPYLKEIVFDVTLLDNKLYSSYGGFFVLTFIVIIVVFYLYRISVKQIKVTHKKSRLNNTTYPSLHKTVIFNK
ncbi:uncharacterized protein MKS88_000203 [Plasmodium brasilianum]|uniref:uncharacterized protein n=1 Tax=Plasmodium brasilianum TaxID=5824 RepID=UPI00350E4A83|nr:hypothetical protein MKS88_000203 [Plasmodium brasilianum]